jgi:hypothetical protein
MCLSERAVNCLLEQGEDTVEAIENILPTLFKEHGIEDVRIFQAFYLPSLFLEFNITVLLSSNLNLVLVASAYEGFDIGVILKAYEEYKRYTVSRPLWKEIQTRNFEHGKRWTHWFQLNDDLIHQFIEAMQDITIGGMRDIFTSHHRMLLIDDGSLSQYGRYFETPHFSHQFYFQRRFVDLSIFEQRDHFRYFIYLLLFVQAHSKDPLAQNIIAIALDSYESDF